MHARDIRENAIRFTMGVLRQASDWQEGQTALADHPLYGVWLEEQFADDELAMIAEAQSIVRAAEDRLGDALPY
jgi:hypothetical protein